MTLSEEMCNQFYSTPKHWSAINYWYQKKYPWIAEVAIPGRIYCSNSSFASQVCKSRSGNDVYMTFYTFKEKHINNAYKYGYQPTYSSAIIDRVIWDIDRDDKLPQLREIKESYHIETWFSGRHYYAILNLKEIITKEQLRDLHVRFNERYNLESDKHIFGDCARFIRIPFSINSKSNRLVSPCNVYNSHEEIMKKMEQVPDYLEMPVRMYYNYADTL